MEDNYNLQRFLTAQERDYAQALSEIKNGRKRSHWIWYIFPKLKGFGGSSTTKYYGLDGIEEARAYYGHPVLRERLIEITKALLEHRGKSAQDIFPSVDARKVKSCMTLFWLVTESPLFKSVLDAFYEGEMDNNVAKMFGVAKKWKSK